MAKYFNRARMTVTSTGTGAITLGVALTGYQTFSAAGVADGDTVGYAIEDGSSWEIGTGTYTSSGTTLSRTVTASSNSNTAISVTTSAQVFVTALAADLVNASNLTSGTLAAARGGAGTVSGIMKANGSGTVSAASAGTDYLSPPSGTAILKANSGGALANATAGTDYQAAITASGLLKGAGAGSVSAATAGTDYLAPPSGTAILKANSGGALANATAGTDYVVPGGSAGSITATGFKETKTAPSISSGTLALDCSTGNVFAVSLNANITTLSFTNVPSTGTAYGLTLALTADGTARTVTWGAAVKWPGGTAPTLTSTSGKVDTVVLYTHDGGTTWYAFTAGQNA
jgi:hypothetical protein